VSHLVSEPGWVFVVRVVGVQGGAYVDAAPRFRYDELELGG
jgi:hypothetical protein